MLGTLAHDRSSAAKGVFQKVWQQAGGCTDRLSGGRTRSPKGILCSHLLDVVLERPDVLQPHPPPGRPLQRRRPGLIRE